MIVRQFADRLQLITQPDHAQLAGTIMEHCIPLRGEPRRDAILRAVYAHDDGWLEEDAAPRVNPTTGEVVDFVSAPLSVRQTVWPRAVARLGDDAWTAALIAQHAITVYDRFRSQADWTSFFADMKAARDSRLRPGGLSIDALLSDYEVRAAGGPDLADLLHGLDRRATVRPLDHPTIGSPRHRVTRGFWWGGDFYPRGRQGDSQAALSIGC